MRYFLPLLAVPALVAPAPAQASLADVAAHFAALKTMTADFTQSAASGQVARGTLTLARPGRVRFQYEKSVPLLIVADGRTLSMIDYEVAQVSKWPIRSTPLAVLLDPQVNVSRYGRLLTGSAGVPGFVAVEARDPKHPEYGALTLYFQRSAGAPGGLALSAWRALDAQGNVTQVQLSNVRYGAPVAANAFSYRDPRRTGRAPGKG
jgi:outer membrane lipoprotein-sorting protein